MKNEMKVLDKEKILEECKRVIDIYDNDLQEEYDITEYDLINIMQDMVKLLNK